MKIPKGTYLKLFASCILVKGYKRSTICDLERFRLEIISNDLYEVLRETENKKILEIYDYYGVDNKTQIDNYFEFIIDNEYGFFTKYPDRFSGINLQYDRPELITNAIIDTSVSSNHNYSKIFKELNILGCKDLQFRFFDVIKLKELSSILKNLENSRIRSIEILFKYNPLITYEALKKLCYDNPRVYNLMVHSSPIEKNYEGRETVLSKIGTITYNKQSIRSETHCGIIDPSQFSYHIDTFSESQSFNTCLNKKISIDVTGNIKNCPSMVKTYGNHTNTKLTEAVNDISFKKTWSMNKDSIITCKDCEFRHVCSDCRAYLTNPKDLFSKPLKCGYDPYSGQWASWHENKTKQKIFERYKLES